MLKTTLIISFFSFFQISQAGPIADKIKQCKGDSNEAVCVGLVLNRKMNRIMRAVRGGSSKTVVKYFDEANCNVEWGTIVIRQSPSEARCRALAKSMGSLSSSNSFIESISIDGDCTKINDIDRKDEQAIVNHCLLL